MTVFELSYRHVFPAIRRRLVEILHKEYDMEEVDIAKKLGISQAAVSRYISGKRGSLVNPSAHIDVEEMIRQLAEEIAYGSIGKYGIYMELTKITLYMLSRKYVCDYHAKISPTINPEECNICPELFSKIVR